MSMRGELIAQEYQNMTFVNDQNGKEYACYTSDLKNHKEGADLTEDERKRCTDLSQVLGDSW